jgi:Domain of unknown function (DUF4402)
MNDALKFGSALALAAGFAGAAGADVGNPSDATASASVTVVKPIAVSARTPLRFGGLVVDGGGSVTIGTNGTRTFNGGFDAGPSTLGDGNAAEFQILADNYSWDPTILGSTALDGPGDDIALSNITIEVLNGDDIGNGTVYVGATAEIPNGQPAGEYTGSITLRVQYE